MTELKQAIDREISYIKRVRKRKKQNNAIRNLLYPLRYLTKPKYIYVVTCIKMGTEYTDAKKGKDGQYHSYLKRTNRDYRLLPWAVAFLVCDLS